MEHKIWVAEYRAMKGLDFIAEELKEQMWWALGEHRAVKIFVASTPEEATELATKELNTLLPGWKIGDSACTCCGPYHSVDIENHWTGRDIEMQGVAFENHGERGYTEFDTLYDAQKFIVQSVEEYYRAE